MTESFGVAPNWLMLQHERNIGMICCIMIPGLTSEMVLKGNINPIRKHLNSLLTNATSEDHSKTPLDCLIQTGPGERSKLHSCLQNFLNVPLTGKQKQDLKKQLQKIQKNTFGDYLLTREEMIQNEYPLFDTSDLPEGWVLTSQTNSQYTVVALDCEMVITSKGLEPARLSLVDQNLSPIYDSFIVPSSEILDYNTQYSGLTQQHLSDATKTLEQVQQEVLSILSSDTILVGHGLENDLWKLKISHQKCVDTALVYRTHSAGYKPRLKYLAEKFLKKTIQDSDIDGHDSITDAQTAMSLMLLKLKMGYTFGMSNFGMETEPLKERLERENILTEIILEDKSNDNNRNIKVWEKALQEDQEMFQSVMLSLNKEDEEEQQPEEEEQEGKEVVKRKRFLFTRFRGLEQYQKSQFNPDSITRLLTKSTQPAFTNQMDTREILEAYQTYLNQIFASLPANTLFMVLSGHGNTSEASYLLQQKQIYFKKSKKYGQSFLIDSFSDKEINEEDKDKVCLIFDQYRERVLEDAVDKARMGVCCFCIKENEEKVADVGKKEDTKVDSDSKELTKDHGLSQNSVDELFSKPDAW